MNEFRDSRADRLYKLLPAIHRIRDSEQGYPLKALLSIINEQVNLLEDDIERLYENSFIETADDWAVPYIADLIGYHPLTTPGEPGTETVRTGRNHYRGLTTRRDVANTLGHRRRKGTLEILEMLARDIADWPARAVEFYKLLGWLQNLNHSQLQRAQSADIRNVYQLSLINKPFDNSARTVDVRRINSKRTVGRYNLPSIGVFVWRLKSYSVTRTPAFSLGENRYTFNVLGLNTPLFCNPKSEWNYGEENKPSFLNPEEIGLPKPLNLRVFESNRIYGSDVEIKKLKEAYYSPHFKIWVDGWAGNTATKHVPFENIKITDLSKWDTYVPPENTIAVDPCNGRIAFPKKPVITKDVLVSYFYGFSADIGGGEYARVLLEPADPADPATATKSTRYYYVGGSNCLKTIHDALYAIKEWERNQPFNGEKIRSAVIVLTESQVFKETLSITLKPNTYLQLRAANRARPVICPIDATTRQPNAMRVLLSDGSQFVMDGILLASAGLELTSEDASSDYTSRVLIRHSTIPPFQNYVDQPSIKITNLKASVHIEHSIIGAIQIYENEVLVDPIAISISDSLVDSAINSGQKAIKIDAINTKVIKDIRAIKTSAIKHIKTINTLKAIRAIKDIRDIKAIRDIKVIRAIRDIRAIKTRAIRDIRAIKTSAIKHIKTINTLKAIRAIKDKAIKDIKAIKAISAIGAKREETFAHASIRLERCTVFGDIKVHAIEFAENTIFNDEVKVARRQIGCLRFCYVAPTEQLRIPKRYRCQPDLEKQNRTKSDYFRPLYTAKSYEEPGYGQLALECDKRILQERTMSPKWVFIMICFNLNGKQTCVPDLKSMCLPNLM